MNGINVLYLFDAISCGQYALNKANVPYKKYIASEIDKHTIKITQKNYPLTIQYGDCRYIKKEHFFDKINLLIGGSPCQSLSGLGNGSGLKGKSNLFYEYVRLKEEINANEFFLKMLFQKKTDGRMK